jgi:protein-L-isoaspartate(D-aspartate) O-methyltransferase
MQELTRYLIEAGFIKTDRVAKAFLKCDRKGFVRREDIPSAYEDVPLVIGYESTISQPSTVATMIEMLHLSDGNKVLEVGTGSGWEACIISCLVGKKGRVTTIDINQSVEEFAKATIKAHGCANIKQVKGNGTLGYRPNAPYDKIVFTAAVPVLNRKALLQLKKGGRLIAPVGEGQVQVMTVVDRTAKGFERTEHGRFSFVPLQDGRESIEE